MLFNDKNNCLEWGFLLTGSINNNSDIIFTFKHFFKRGCWYRYPMFMNNWEKKNIPSIQLTTELYNTDIHNFMIW